MTEPRTTSSGTGLAPNVAGALCYLFMPITGILFLVVEKESRFVRFHAAQATIIGVGFFVLNIGLSIVGMILGQIPIINIIAGLAGLLLYMVLALGGFLLWLFLMYQAFQGNEWEFPVAGGHARRLAAPPAIAPPQ
jgi:uncharacterized membrane protein